MKITIIHGAFFPVPPIQGGAVEKLWFQLGQEFSELGHSVTHITKTTPNSPKAEVNQNPSYLRVKGYDVPRNIFLLKWRDLKYSIRVLRAIQKSDVIITNTFWIPVFLRNKKYHGRIVVDVARMPKGQIPLYSHVSRLRCNSQEVSQRILKQSPNHHCLTKVIPNPLPFRPTALSENGQKKNTILYVGRVHPEKGIELLLKAFRLAYESSLKGWNLKIIGPWSIADGGGGEKWKQELESTYLNQKIPIEWKGPIFKMDELGREYSKAKIFLYPSLADNGETFGLAPLEAMSYGCCPIVSDLACFKDFITHNFNGLIFKHYAKNPEEELSQYIIKLASSEAELDRISSQSILVRETHHPTKIAKEFLDDFQYLIQQNA